MFALDPGWSQIEPLNNFQSPCHFHLIGGLKLFSSYHPSKNGMMLPNASINFGVRKSTPNLIDADGSRSTTRASPDEVNGHGDSPLHLACRLGPFARSYFVKRTIQSPKSDQHPVWPQSCWLRHSWPRVSGMKPCCTSGRRHSRAVTRRVRLALRVGLVWQCSFVHQWGIPGSCNLLAKMTTKRFRDTLLASPCGNS